jgi:paraquat-inducible protein B
MKDALRSETQFWLVTPKASLAGVSGLDALVGGNYIGMMPGKGSRKSISPPSTRSPNIA